MKTTKKYEKYTYLIEDDNFYSYLYRVEYDSKRLTDLINNYSLKSGANIVEKQLLGSLTIGGKPYEGGRIIEEKVVKKKNSKAIQGGFVPAPSHIYYYKIIENESEFIKNLVDCFEVCSNFNYNPYIFINFSKVYDMISSGEFSKEDILFLKEVLQEFKFYQICFDGPLPHRREIKEEHRKNSCIVDLDYIQLDDVVKIKKYI